MIEWRHNSKICKAVIVSDAIEVMHKFLAVKNAPQMLLHYEAVFKDITIMVSKGMVGLLYSDIALRCFRSAILIPMMFRSMREMVASRFLPTRTTPPCYGGHRLATFGARDSVPFSSLDTTPLVFQLVGDGATIGAIFRKPLVLC